MINIDNVPVDLLCLDKIPVVREVDILEMKLEEDENPLDQYRVCANESALIQTIPCETSEEIITMAPGEVVIQISILTDTHCEQLAHPQIPPGTFGYKLQRKVELSPVKYFNQRFLNYINRSSPPILIISFLYILLCKISM